MKRVLLILVGFVLFTNTFATHLRGGQITIRNVNCGTREYEITVTIYTNTQSPILAGGGTLSFGDGVSLLIPKIANTIIDPVNAVGQVVYTINHRFLNTGAFTISYMEANRNVGILNMGDSGTTPFYIESYILVDPLFCSHTMQFSIAPIDRACSGTAFTHNPGVIIPDGDSLSYQIVAPLQARDITVRDYTVPNSPKFYAGNFQNGNESHNGVPTYTIGSDGTLTWNAPGIVGEYGAAIKVFLWTNVNGRWINTGWIERDLQITVEDCGTSRPYLLLPADVCIQAGNKLKTTFRGFSTDLKQVKIEVTSLEDDDPLPKFSNTGVFQSTAPPNDTANMKLTWDISCKLVRQGAHRFIFKISSFTKNGTRVSSYQTWNVTVVGPPPKYQSLNLDVATKKLTIQWVNYFCSSNAPVMQVWRRVDRLSLQPGDCQPGIPKSWGFVKIGETTSTSFTDPNLSPGATYCYRLVAAFTNPNTALSLASKDTCIGPIVVDAPAMVNVSVTKTDSVEGVIFTRWTSPFQINKSLFPPPYQYTVLRTADGERFKSIAAKINDTTFVDSHLDIVDTLYGYKVVMYSPSSIAHDTPVDTSALAFYPRLVPKALQDSIKLTWDATVPWSDQSDRFPWHYIYRKELGAGNFVLIDSVNVLDNGFEYKDNIHKDVFPLENNIIYQYKILTQGTYGNPKIIEPLRNFSNEVLAQPIDISAPCAPTLEVSSIDCETLLNSPCSVNTFNNRLTWANPDDCGNDVARYEVFFSPDPQSDSTLLVNVSDANYVDPRQKSMAGCYRVLAVDRSGNIGPLSNKVCVENCINVFIPNLITVNDDGFNEKFPDLLNATDTRDSYKCPRFVRDYSMEIFNRWGEQVYSLGSAVSQTNGDWTGLDQKGRELPAGVYYYTAEVYFYTSDPKLKTQKLKGWVTLVR
ncbi:hypothetical protein WSM22_12980 [Cytophagales bacterium WSM2-2]|nr:hypothetical protein WSM22_12980 [Cytophagales bacterium WSM2-2]